MEVDKIRIETTRLFFEKMGITTYTEKDLKDIVKIIMENTKNSEVKNEQ